MKIVTAALLLAASLAAPVTAQADCGQDDQPACNGFVPTVDQVMAMLGELADPNIPAMGKNDIVTPPFNDDQAQKFDTMMGLLRLESIVPVNWTVTDIDPAPNNTAGATVSNPPAWHERGGTGPIELVLQNGRWMITHQTAVNRVANLARNQTHVHGI
jgi:hypothetical protein